MEENTSANEPIDSLELLTLEQVARILGVSMSTIRRYKDRKINPLPVIYLSSQEVRVLKSELLEWAKALPDPRREV